MIVLERKLFARRDYEGLDEISKKKLKMKRGEIAEKLNRSRNKNNLLYETKDELFPKNHKKYLNTRNNSHSNSLNLADIAKKESYEKLKTEGNIRRAENIKSIRRARKLKKAGKIGLAAVGTAGLVYGGKKLYDRYKKDSQKEFARRDYDDYDDQKEFARKDYIHLDWTGKDELKNERSKIAKELNKGRKKNNILLDSASGIFPDKRKKYLNLRNNSHNAELNKAKINKDIIYNKIKEANDHRLDEFIKELENSMEGCEEWHTTVENRAKNIKKMRKRRIKRNIGKGVLGASVLAGLGVLGYKKYKDKKNK